MFVCHQSGILNRKMSLAQLYEVTVGPLVHKYFITKWWQILLRILERILHFNYLLMKSLHFITFVVYWTKKLPRQVMREAASAHECRNVFWCFASHLPNKVQTSRRTACGRPHKPFRHAHQQNAKRCLNININLVA